MFEFAKNILRRRKLRKFGSDIPTGFVPLTDISVVNVLLDVEEPGFDLLKEDILTWGRRKKLKINIYFFDFRKLNQDELLLTSIQTTIIKKELNWYGMPDMTKTWPLINEPSDLFISLVDSDDFPTEFVGKCSRARFKIGRRGYEGDPYNMVITGSPTEDLRSESRKIFAAIADVLDKVR